MAPRPVPSIQRFVFVGFGLLVALVAVTIYFLGAIADLVKEYHSVCVLGFTAAVAIWTWWVGFSLFRRKVEAEGDGRQ
jgi:hypothetical protein